MTGQYPADSLTVQWNDARRRSDPKANNEATDSELDQMIGAGLEERSEDEQSTCAPYGQFAAEAISDQASEDSSH